MSLFFVSSIMHIFLKAYLNFKSKLFKSYTFSCTPPTSIAIKIRKKNEMNYLCAYNNFCHP